jgi:hypothetical protein
MKNKMLVCFVVIGILVGSMFLCANITPAKAEATRNVCPSCHGTGQIPCSRCNGTGQISLSNAEECPMCHGAKIIVPVVRMRLSPNSQLDPSNPNIVIVKGFFQNIADFDTNGTVTASFQGIEAHKTLVKFPAHQDVNPIINLDFSDIPGGPDTSKLQFVKMSVSDVHDVTCPTCLGQGVVAGNVTCPDCFGIGAVQCPTCSGTGYIGADVVAPGQDGTGEPINFLLIGEVGGGAAAAVVVGMSVFVVMKKKRISEKSLRTMPPGEFNTWVLSRLSGKPGTSQDNALGISGFTSAGYPVMIKQADNVGLAEIDRFAASLARSRAKNGLIVAFGFGTDAIRGKVRARMTYRLDIEMVTVQDLMLGKRS